MANSNTGHDGGAVLPVIVFSAIEEKNSPAPPSTPKSNAKAKVPLTPKVGKENIQQLDIRVTPKSNLIYTPTRLTRSALKLNDERFATPRAPPRAPPRTPLSANKMNIQRQNSVTNLTVKTPTNVNRSKSQTHIVRAKNLPPLI